MLPTSRRQRRRRKLSPSQHGHIADAIHPIIRGVDVMSIRPIAALLAATFALASAGAFAQDNASGSTTPATKSASAAPAKKVVKKHHRQAKKTAAASTTAPKAN